MIFNLINNLTDKTSTNFPGSHTHVITDLNKLQKINIQNWSAMPSSDKEINWAEFRLTYIVVHLEIAKNNNAST